MTDREELGRLADRMEGYSTSEALPWRNSDMKDAASALRRLAEAGTQEAVLCCDVRLPPVTTIRAGCKISTLMAAISVREKWPEEDRHFTAPTAPSVAVPSPPYVVTSGYSDYTPITVRADTSALITAPQDDVREARSDEALETEARELLAKEYDTGSGEGPYPSYASLARDPSHTGAFTMCAIRAIKAALRGNQSDGGVEGHAEFASGGKSRAMEATDHRESCAETLGDPEALCSNSPEATGVGIKPGPSDPTPSRPEVSVAELAYWFAYEMPVDESSSDKARALKAKYHMEGRE
jgi:hypothetical protein